MPAYSIRVKIDQIVTREVVLLVEAKDEATAKEMSLDALEVYPKPVPYNPMIHRIVTTKTDYWIPKSIDFVEIKEDDENN